MEIITPDLSEKLFILYHNLERSGRLREGVYQNETIPYMLFDLAELPESPLSEKIAFGVNRASEADKIRIQLEFNVGRRDTYRRLIKDLEFLIFVCRDVPEEFQQIWAVHEYVEGYTQSHEYATKKSFEEAKRKGLDFLERFARYFATEFKNIKIKEEALRSIIPIETLPIFREAGYL